MKENKLFFAVKVSSKYDCHAVGIFAVVDTIYHLAEFQRQASAKIPPG